jgi:clan AA aspartic protease (TIGR02281 family)
MRRLGVFLACSVCVMVAVFATIITLPLILVLTGLSHQTPMAMLIMETTKSVGASNSALSNVTVVPERERQPRAYVIAARGNNGLFFVVGSISDQEIKFSIDMGANGVYLTPEDAARVPNLKKAESVQQTLADGTTRDMVKIVIPSLRIGQIALDDIDGFILPEVPAGLKQISLLGLSYTDGLNWAHEKYGNLVLSQ